MVNVDKKIIWISFASTGIICFIPIILEVLCVFGHVVRRRQMVLSESDSDLHLEEDKTNQSLLMLACPLESGYLQSLQSFVCFWPSKADRNLQLLISCKCSCICSESCSFRTKTWFNTSNFNLWSCILEHILADPIVLFILYCYQNFKDIVQNSVWFNIVLLKGHSTLSTQWCHVRHDQFWLKKDIIHIAR